MIETFLRWLGIGDAPTFGAARGPQWGQTRKAYLRSHPVSEISGSKGSLLNPLQVHHKKSFASRPELENDFLNLMTVTLWEHFVICHLCSWRSLNENIEEDMKIWKRKIASRPKWNGTEWVYNIKVAN